MPTRFVFQGLEELKAQIRTLPDDLTREASRIIEGEANGAAVAIRAAYGAHRRSGNLQNHVFVSFRTTGLHTGATVKSTARHAHLFEYGSQARHTSLGAFRGSMPAAHTFVPALIRARRFMYFGLANLLQRHGLLVSGTP